jgi:hypothetical protein
MNVIRFRAQMLVAALFARLRGSRNPTAISQAREETGEQAGHRDARDEQTQGYDMSGAAGGKGQVLQCAYEGRFVAYFGSGQHPTDQGRTSHECCCEHAASQGDGRAWGPDTEPVQARRGGGRVDRQWDRGGELQHCV